MKLFRLIDKKMEIKCSNNDDMYWYGISRYKKLSEDFIREFQYNVDWKRISIFQNLSEDFINEFQDKVDWFAISEHQKLSENFIRKFADKVKWVYISQFQKLSENFIREFQDKVDWVSISTFQKLDENFIKEFQNKVDWINISKYQRLSENFIREFQDKVDWYLISKYQVFSEDFIREFKNKLSLFFIKDSWYYKSIEEKKNALIKIGKYECHDDYFIAYKAIKENRCSLYNFQYQYLPNEEYESWCDYSDSENSFGLSVGTYDYCKEYLGSRLGMVVKCKVKYEDIGRIMHKGGKKIRCFKIKILE